MFHDFTFMTFLRINFLYPLGSRNFRYFLFRFSAYFQRTLSFISNLAFFLYWRCIQWTVGLPEYCFYLVLCILRCEKSFMRKFQTKNVRPIHKFANWRIEATCWHCIVRQKIFAIGFSSHKCAYRNYKFQNKFTTFTVFERKLMKELFYFWSMSIITYSYTTKNLYQFLRKGFSFWQSKRLLWHFQSNCFG